MGPLRYCHRNGYIDRFRHIYMFSRKAFLPFGKLSAAQVFCPGTGCPPPLFRDPVPERLSLPSRGTFRSFQGFRPETASRFPGILSPSEAHSQLHGRTTQTLLTFLESSDDLFLDFLSLLRLSLRPISINQLNTLLCLHL